MLKNYKMAGRILHVGLLISLAIFSIGCAARHKETFMVMSYNVENLFDDIANGKEYREFDPNGGKWNTHLFHAKIERIAEVFRLIKENHGAYPEIMVLQEIENRNTATRVLRQLIDTWGYTIVMPPQYTDAVTTVVYSRFPVKQVHVHSPSAASRRIALRPILELEIAVTPDISIHLFANHWKSKRGRAQETEAYRRAAATIVAQRSTALLRDDPMAKIIVVGDFNEAPDEYVRVGKEYITALMPHEEIKKDPRCCMQSLAVTFTRPHTSASEHPLFYSSWEETSQPGSYWYRSKKQWEKIDAIFVSENFFDGIGYQLSDFMVVDYPQLLNRDGHPYSFNERTGNGYSDHLPIMAHFLYTQ